MSENDTNKGNRLEEQAIADVIPSEEGEISIETVRKSDGSLSVSSTDKAKVPEENKNSSIINHSQKSAQNESRINSFLEAILPRRIRRTIVKANRRLVIAAFSAAVFSLFLEMVKPDSNVPFQPAYRADSVKEFIVMTSSNLWISLLRLSPAISLGIATSLFAGVMSDLAVLYRQKDSQRRDLANILGMGDPDNKIALVMTRFTFNRIENTLEDGREIFFEGICVDQKVYGGDELDKEYPDTVMLSSKDFDGAILLLKLFKLLDIECDIRFDYKVFENYGEIFAEYIKFKTNNTQGTKKEIEQRNTEKKHELREKLVLDENTLNKYKGIISLGWHSNELTGWMLHKAKSNNEDDREFIYLRPNEELSINKKESFLTRARIPGRLYGSKPNVVIIGGEKAEDTYDICNHFHYEYSTLLRNRDMESGKFVEEAEDFRIKFSKANNTLKSLKVKCLAKLD